MSRRLRIALAMLGVTIALISIFILAYAYWPAVATREQYRLAPTVFAPPR